MDYKKILSSELRRRDCGEPEAYGDRDYGTAAVELAKDCEFLLKNIPTEKQIIDAMQTLIDGNADRSVALVPVLPFLQTKLKVTSQRLGELLNDNGWIRSWIDHIRALQEVKIMDLFSAGNMEDAKLKWLLWAILGEPVDLTIARASVAANAETMLNTYGTDS
jgi:hypothetical protein